MSPQTFSVEGSEPVKLVSYLKESLGISSKQIKRSLENNCCTVNGRVERFASTLVYRGDRIIFDRQPGMPRKFEPEQGRILYEDHHLLAYNKPSGISCDPAGVLSLFPAARLVHRLDKETTGVLLLAKTSEMADHLKTCFRERNVKKKYSALVHGGPVEDAGLVDNRIAPLRRYQGQVIWGEDPKGKDAVTKWETVKRGESFSLIDCYPVTGRTHQIRVHLKGLGCPILGDYQYDRERAPIYHAKRCMLHAAKISFYHPRIQRELAIIAPLPDDFVQAIDHVLR